MSSPLPSFFPSVSIQSSQPFPDCSGFLLPAPLWCTRRSSAICLPLSTWKGSCLNADIVHCVIIQVLLFAIIALGRARIAVASRILRLTQTGPAIERQRDKGRAQIMRREPDADLLAERNDQALDQLVADTLLSHDAAF